MIFRSRRLQPLTRTRSFAQFVRKAAPQTRRQPISVEVLGTRIAVLTRHEVIERVRHLLAHGPASVYFVNAHTANLAANDTAYRSCLNRGNLVVNDGTGIRWAAGLRGVGLTTNHVGTDLVPWLLAELSGRDQGIRLFLFGSHEETVVKAAEFVSGQLPGVQIVGTCDGFREGHEAEAATRIAASAPDLCLVGLGNPKQELWIDRNLGRFGQTVAVAVGGLFEYWAGSIRRAPSFFRRNGMEWVYILWRQPEKWRRYLVGNPLFLLRVLRERR